MNKKIFFCFVMILILALSIFLPIKKDIDLVLANQQNEELSSIQDFLDFENSIIELNNDNNVEPIYISNNDTMMALNDAALSQDIIENEENIVNEQNIQEYCDLNNSYYISSVDGYSIYTNFALKRLIVSGTINNTYGAIKVISGYNDISILCYETETATEYAYNKLSKDKNLSVSIDKFSAPSSYAQTSYDYSNYKNWGAKAADIGGYTQYLKDNNVDKEVVVVVMDTGINTSHEMFEGRLLTDGNGKVRGYSYFNSPYHYSYDNLAFDVDDKSTSDVNEADTNKYSFEDDHKHGTHVAGIICSLTPSNVKILPIKISNPTANNTSTSSIFLAAYSRIIEIYSNQYNIVCVNLSFSGAGKNSESDKNIFNAQSYIPLKAKNILPITAAGNESEEINIEGLEAVVVSALQQTTIGVEFDRSYSNYGKIIDIAAAGTEITSAAISSTDSACTSNYITLQGTSMASPQVAGIVALLYLDPIYNSSPCTANEIESRLYENAIDLGNSGYDVLYGHGALNIRYFEAAVNDDVVINFYNGTEQIDASQSFMYLEEGFDLTIKCSDPTYSIYYSKSTDYFMPSALTEVEYTSPLLIDNTAYICAIAYKMNGDNIVSRSNMYTISFFVDSGNIEDYFIMGTGGQIVDYTGHFTKLDVPEYVRGVQVKAIGTDVFAYSELEYVTLPTSCNSIGGRAFMNCENLTYIYGPSVTKIYLAGFWQCEALRMVTSTTPDNDATEGAYFPKLTELVSHAFTYCTGLEECYLPNLIGIPEYCFYECVNLKTFHIGANVSTLGPYAFYKNNLEEFTIDSNNKYFYTDGVAVYNSDTVLTYASGNPTKSLNILDTVTINGVTTNITKTAQALLAGQTLNQVTIPKNMEELGYFFCSSGGYIGTLYYNAASLSDYYYDAEANGTYSMFNKVSKLVIGDTVVSFPQRLFLFTLEIDEIVIKSINTSFGTYSLYQYDREAKTNILYLDFTDSINSTWISNLTKSSIQYNLPNYIYTKVSQTFTGYFSSYKQVATNGDWLVYSTGKVNSYTINHYQESLTNNGSFVDENGIYYRLIEQETQYGDAGSSTHAIAKAYDGFTAQNIIQQTIAADNSTIVNILYTRNSYTLTLNKDSYIQNVEGAGVYKYGQSVTINASAQEGYVFNKWVSSNSKLTPDSTSQNYTFTMPANNITLTATSKIQTFTIEISSSNNGSISPNGTQVVEYGSSLSLTITPDTYYQIKQVLIDDINNSSAVSSGKYTFTNIIANHTVYVKFDHQTTTYTVQHYQENLTNTGVLIDGTYYSIAEIETLTGNVGFNTTAISKSYAGFTAQAFSQNTVAQDGSTVVRILYKRTYFSLSLDKSTGIDKVTGSGIYKYGQQITINATLNEGYVWTKWTSSDVSVLADSTSQSYTFTMPASNINLVGSAEKQTFPITITHSAGGTISVTGNYTIDKNGVYHVEYNSTLTITLEPNADMKGIINVELADGSTFTSAANYAFDSVGVEPATTPTSIHVEFIMAITTYTVNHYQESLTGEYTLFEYETLSGDVDGTTSAESNTYTGFTAQEFSQSTIAQDGSTTVNIYYDRNEYTLTLNKDDGINAVTGTGTYKYGKDITISATLNEGYNWNKWTSSNTNLLAHGTPQSYIFTMPAGNITLTASTMIKTFIIEISNVENGKVTPSGTQVVNYDSSLTITITPNTNYKIHQVLIDGVNTPSAVSNRMYTFANIKANHTVSVTFIIATSSYTINHYQENVTTGYTLFENEVLYGNAGDTTAATSKTYTGFTALEFSQSTIAQDGSTTINIYYNRNKYKVTLNIGDGISSVNGAGTYKYGQEVTINATLIAGYSWNKWASSDSNILADGGSQSYTFTMPNSNITFTATGKLQTFTITITHSKGGTISASGKYTIDENGIYHVEYNSKLTIEIYPDADYKIESVLVNGFNSSAAVNTGSYTFTNISANHVVQITFKFNAANYTVKHYQENLTNTGTLIDETYYNLFESETLSGGVGTTTQAKANTYTGFNSLSISQQTILEDGSTTVNVLYNRIEYSISVSTVEGVSGYLNENSETHSSVRIAKYGQFVSIKAVLEVGYNFVEWNVTSGSLSADLTQNPCSFEVIDNVALSPTLAKQNFTITISSSANGSVTPSGTQTINYGSSLTITISPNPNYETSQVLIDGVNNSSAVNSGKYILANVTANHTIYVEFKRQTADYVVNHYQESLTTTSNYLYNKYYTLADTDTLTGNVGDTTSAIVKEYEGFTSPSITQQSIKADNSTIINIYYDRIEYVLTLNKDEGIASVTGAGTYKYGKEIAINAVLNEGYSWNGWTSNTNKISNSSSQKYSFNMPATNATLTAGSILQTFTIQISVLGSGMVSPNGTQTVGYGSSLTISITPNVHHEISKVLVDNVNKGSITSYTFENITQNHTLEVTFIKLEAEYIVNHYQENLNNSGILFDNLYYTLVDQETITGDVGNSTQAQAKTFEGFTALAITQKTIEKEVTTIVDVLYIRNSYILSLNKDEGIDSISGEGVYKYGQSISAEATLNDGYVWAGWSSNSNKLPDSSNQKYTFNMPATDITLSATSRIKTFKITLNISGGCEVSYDNPLENIIVGESRTFDIYCKEYWKLEGVYVNGEKVEVVNNQITLTNITEDLTIRIVVIEQYRFHPLMIAGIIFGGGTLLAITIFIFVRKKRKKRWNWV